MEKKLIALMAFFVIVFTSCDDRDTNIQQCKTIAFTSGVNEYSTRVNETGDGWIVNDAIGIYMLNNGENSVVNDAANIRHTSDAAGKLTTFTAEKPLYYLIDDSAVDFIAYHPYSEKVTDMKYPVNLTGQSNQAVLDLMYAESKSTQAEGYTQAHHSAVELTFDHILTKMVVNLTLVGFGENTSDISATIKGMNRTAEFDLSTGQLSSPASNGDITPYTASARQYEAILLPVETLTESHTVAFDIDGKTYNWKILSNTLKEGGSISKFEQGSKYTFNVTVSKSSEITAVAVTSKGSVSPWDDGGTAGGAAEEVLTCYFVATDGDDSNPGTISKPFASLSKAHSMLTPGDTVYIRGGTYKIKEEQMMNPNPNTTWSYVFDFSDANHTGTRDKPIRIWGYEDEKPVFDLSEVKPANKRVIVFYVSRHYYHFKNFEIVGTQVTIVGHTQSECFRNDGGNGNIYENLAMHDGMAIGFYLVRGQNNLVLNCDAYNNFDPVSDGGRGGNVDGFGGHPSSTGSTGNVFRGCRAWWNSDDGFDLINSWTSFTIENCWSFYNGYKPGGFESAGDGAGFKSGGYGMSENPNVPASIPVHVVRGCLAYYNKNQGFYANHHLGGITWYNNTGYRNPSNFNMLNRKSAAEAIDDPDGGYGHILINNVSFSPRTPGNDIINVNQSRCTISSNTFLSGMTVTATDFLNVDDPEQLMRTRKADGSLPDIDFLKPSPGSQLIGAGEYIGEAYTGTTLGCFQ